MSDHHTQAKDREPDSFDADLHPNPNAGINDARLGANPKQDAPSAHDITALRNALPDFDDAELRRISVLRPGDTLEQGATYIDLRDMQRGEWTAERPADVGPDDLFVAKQVTDYQIWNRLRGIDDPRRTGG